MYSGQVYIGGTGHFGVEWHIDDNGWMMLDGKAYGGDWNDTFDFSNLTVGWHNIEFRVSNGTGGAGGTFGFHNVTDLSGRVWGATSMETPVDPGTLASGTVFRVPFGGVTTTNSIVATGNSVVSMTDSNSLTTTGTVRMQGGLTLAGPSGLDPSMCSMTVGGTTLTGNAELISDMAYNTPGIAGGGYNFAKTGAGTLQLTGASTNLGAVAVNGGKLLLTGAGTLDSTSGASTRNGAIVFQETATPSVNRFPDASPIKMFSGLLSHIGPSGSATTVTSETIGAVTVHGGVTIDATVTGTGTRGISKLTMSNLVRDTGGMINFTRTESSTTNRGEIHILVNSTGSIAGGDYYEPGPTPASGIWGDILGGWAVVNGNDFATYEETDYSVPFIGRGVVAIPANEYNTSTDQTTWAGTNVKTGAVQLGDNRSVNSIRVDLSAAGTLDLNTKTLTVDTGGILHTGTANLNINNGTITAGAYSNQLYFWENTTGTGYFYTNVNAAIANKADSTPVSIVIDSTVSSSQNIVELTNTGNSFTGGIYISGGAFQPQAASGAGNVIGANAITFSGTSTMYLRDNGAGNNGTIAYGNAVNLQSDATINADHATGANTGNTFALGLLTMSHGRTLTVSAGDGYAVSFAGLAFDPTATRGILNNSAPVTIASPGLNDGGSGKTLIKNGAGYLTLNAAAANWTPDSQLIINAGTVGYYAGALGNGAGASAPAITINSGAKLDLQGQNLDLTNANFNTGGILRISAQQDTTQGAVVPLKPVARLEINYQAVGSNYNGVQIDTNGSVTWTLNTADGATVNYDSDIVLVGGQVTFDHQPGTGPVNGNPGQQWILNGQISGDGGLVKNTSNNWLNLYLRRNSGDTRPNTYTGGTTVNAGYLEGNFTGAFGTGPVTINNGAEASLQATAAANNIITVNNGNIDYRATNGAGGGHLVSVLGTDPGTSVGRINMDWGATAGSDTFYVKAFNVIRGQMGGMMSLTRGVNVTIEPNAIVGMWDNGSGNNNTVQNLGTASDLFWAGADLDDSVTIGAGTAFKGVSSDRDTRWYQRGTIYISNPPATPFPTVIFQTILNNELYLGNNGDGDTNTRILNILPAAGSNPAIAQVISYCGNNADLTRVPQNYGGLRLDPRTATGLRANFSGISEWDITAGSEMRLDSDFAMGNEAVPAQCPPIMVLAGGALGIHPWNNNYQSINGTVNLMPPGGGNVHGGILFIGGEDKLNGIGTINAQAGSIVQLTDWGNGGRSQRVLLNTAETGSGTQTGFLRTTPGLVIRLDCDNIKYLDESVGHDDVFEVYDGDRHEDQNTLGNGLGRGGITLNRNLTLGAASGMLTEDNGTRRYYSNQPTLIDVNGGTVAANTGQWIEHNAQIRDVGFNVATPDFSTVNPANPPGTLFINYNGNVEGLDKGGEVDITGDTQVWAMDVVRGDLHNEWNNNGVAWNWANIVSGAYAYNGITIEPSGTWSLRLYGGTAGDNVPLNINQKVILKGGLGSRDWAIHTWRSGNNPFPITWNRVSLDNADLRFYGDDGTGDAWDDNGGGSFPYTVRTHRTRMNLTLLSDSAIPQQNSEFDLGSLTSDGTTRNLYYGRPGTGWRASMFGQVTNGAVLDVLRGEMVLRDGSGIGVGGTVRIAGKAHPTPLPTGFTNATDIGASPLQIFAGHDGTNANPGALTGGGANPPTSTSTTATAPRSSTLWAL